MNIGVDCLDHVEVVVLAVKGWGGGLSMAILVSLSPSQAAVISPSLMLDFPHRVSMIMTMRRSPDSSLL